MLPEPEISEQTPQQRLKPLNWLEDEFRVNYGLAATRVGDWVAPHLNVSMPGTYGYQVYLTMRDGQLVYLWGDFDATHPGCDPSGCARRIVTTLRQERRDKAAA